MHAMGTFGEKELRRFVGKRMGDDIPANYGYVDSFIVRENVWHIFEIMEEPV